MANFTPDFIVDDQSLLLDGGSYFTFTQSWSRVSEPGLGLYDNTSTISLNGTVDVGLNLTFSGVSATIFGNFDCSPDLTSCPYNATLDSNPTEILRAPSSTILYQGSGFSDGAHVLQLIFGFNQTSVEVDVDYALVHPSEDTNLSGDSLYVNHNSTNVIQYTGDWKISTDGTTRDSMTPGDTMWFPFYGNDITVFGDLHQNGVVGNLNFSVSIDNETAVPISIAANSSATDISFFTYFSAQLASRSSATQDVNHTIAIEIQEVTGTQKFSFMAFQFTPNFATLSSMPNLPSPPSTSTSTSSTASTSPRPTTSPGSSSGTSSHAHHTGAIVGGVVAALVGLGLLAFAIFIVRKRRRRSAALSNSPIESQSQYYRDDPTATYRYGNNTTDTSQVPPPTSSTIAPFTKRYHNDDLSSQPEPDSSLYPLLTSSDPANPITPYDKSYINTISIDQASNSLGIGKGSSRLLPPGAAPSLSPGHLSRSPTYQSATGTNTSSSFPLHLPSPPSESHPLSPLRGSAPTNEVDLDDQVTVAETENNDPNRSGGGGSGRFPTRRRMMEMIERLNYQVQALSSTQNPVAEGDADDGAGRQSVFSSPPAYS